MCGQVSSPSPSDTKPSLEDQNEEDKSVKQAARAALTGTMYGLQSYTKAGP